MQRLEPLTGEAILFAQSLEVKPVYTMQDAISVAGSSKTAYRRLNELKSLGVASYSRGQFILKHEVLSQPAGVIQKILPSLAALSRARRFGRNYDDSDVRFALKHLPRGFVTLDYRAYELVRFQLPRDLFLYVDEVDAASDSLKGKGFKEGRSGQIVLLPKTGDFVNEIERVYFDCIANGGRSTLDAIAIEILYEDRLSTKGLFPVQLVRKVEEDLPTLGK